jgi:TRAP-type C4-dicarboxylate transport system permease small subunit
MIPIGALIAIIAINFATSIWLAKVEFLSSKQKLAQGLMVWLVPVIGAVIVASFLFSSRERPERRSHDIPQDSDYPGVNLETSHESHNGHVSP